MKFSSEKIKSKTSPIFDIVGTILIFFIMIILLSNPKKYSSGTIDGIKLFFNSILPGLFPFMILTKLITEMGIIIKFCTKFDKLTYKIFGTNGLGLYAFFMSIISGYPIGSKIISDLFTKNLISKNEAKKMSIFCTTSGPIFIIGAVGAAMFNSIKIGIIIYISHIISSLLLGIFYNIITKKQYNLNQKNYNLFVVKPKNIINLCVNDTINALFIVCAYVTIFYLIGEILTELNVFTILSQLFSPTLSVLNLSAKYLLGIFYGILEVTRGVKTLSVFADKVAIILSTGLISFSGISIIFQSMSFLKNAKIKMHKFILSKLIHSIFSMVICFFILLLE